MPNPHPEQPADGLTVVVPAFNEERGIAGVVRELRGFAANVDYPVEIVVVDDGSIDGTSKALADVVAEPGAAVRVIRNDVNSGYGFSLKRGIREARYGIIVITDADGTYPNSKIPELVDRVRAGADMAVGARSLASASVPTVRKPAKWLLNALANFLAGRKVPDLNSGLRAMRRSLVLRFEPIIPNGFSFTTTITLAALTNRFIVDFLPIEYAKRTGTSKIRPIRDTINFFNLVVRTVLYFRPLKVFIPLSVLAFVASAAIAIRDLLASAERTTRPHNSGKTFWEAFINEVRIGDPAFVIFLGALNIMFLGYLADLACDVLRPADEKPAANSAQRDNMLVVFSMAAFGMLLLALFWHFRDISIGRPMLTKTLVAYSGALQIFSTAMLADVLRHRGRLRS